MLSLREPAMWESLTDLIEILTDEEFFVAGHGVSWFDWTSAVQLSLMVGQHTRGAIERDSSLSRASRPINDRRWAPLDLFRWKIGRRDSGEIGVDVYAPRNMSVIGKTLMVLRTSCRHYPPDVINFLEINAIGPFSLRPKYTWGDAVTHRLKPGRIQSPNCPSLVNLKGTSASANWSS